jgi:two-component system, cell cycle sensor histidine kinase and response regulator CckA
MKSLENYTKEELIDEIEKLRGKIKSDCGPTGYSLINFKTLLEATTDVVFVLDTDQNMIYRNSAWYEFFPKKEEENGKFYRNYIPENELERTDYIFSSVLKEGKSYKNEIMKAIISSGDPKYFSISFSPIKKDNEEIAGLIGIMKNITERFLTQKQLKESKKVLEEKAVEQIKQSEEIKELRDLNDEIINNAPIGIFMMDLSGIMLSENAALRQMMGREPHESIVGYNLMDYPNFKKSGFGKLFERCKLEKKTVKDNNRRYMPIANKREIIINITMDPIINSAGSVEKVIVMVDDNTEQALITERFQTAEKFSAIGHLASGVASELKDPINKMVMDLNFVSNNVNEDNPAHEYIGSMKSALKKIKNMSDQLLTLSRPGEGDKEDVDINKLLTTHPFDVVYNRMKEEGFEVVIETSDTNPLVRATPSQLRRILSEIIENAEEAMPEKGRLSITTGDISTDTGPFVMITISDTGIGMPEENLKRIFNPFFTTKGHEATGLGLLTASNVVENLGGFIGVKSSPSEGTSFRITLPIVTENSDKETVYER